MNEMTARRSLNHSMGIFQSQVMEKPVAILTAFRGEVSWTSNRKANAQLANDLKRLDLGFYPVKGAGQEERYWLFGLFRYVVPSREESFVVQPRSDRDERVFVSMIQGLMQKYGQFAAMMKVPSSPQAFLLHADGSRENKGSGAGPTTVQDNYYTQLKRGPRADTSMLRPWEIHGERDPLKRLVNWRQGRTFMNYPANRAKIGRRFSIKNVPRTQQSEEA